MITLDIVTPYRTVLTGMRVPSVKIPAGKGEIEVLPGHRELLSTLDIGPLAFHDEGRDRKFAISYGFVEIRNDRVLVLSETCEESHEIDTARAKTAQTKSEEMLTSTLTDKEFRKYHLKLRRSISRQGVSGS